MMKKYWQLFLAVVLALLLLGGCERMKQQTEQHQLIDRAVLFDNPEIAGAELSPDGNYISFLKAHDGILNIWVKKVEEPFEAAKLLTESKRPLSFYFWTEDSQYILYVKDNDGDENFNLYAVKPTDIQQDKIPESRNLTPLKDVRVVLNHLSRSNPDEIMIGLNNRDKAWHDLYKLSIKTGELEEIYQNTDRIVGYEFDWDDQLRIFYRTDEAGNTEILQQDKDLQLTKIYETNVEENASIVGWSADNSKVYLVTNKGNLDLQTLFLFDLADLSLTKIESDPHKKVDIASISFDRNTRKMIATSYVDDKVQYYWKDATWKGYYQYLIKHFPEREVSFTSYSKDYTKFLVSVWGDKYASETYLFIPDVKNTNNKLVFQFTSRPKLKQVENYLSPMQAISYKSSDELEIPAYLTIPKGVKAGNLSLVVLVHGGPKGPRDYWGFDPIAQFLANRGYAVLQPNFRASGGYGKKFMNAGDLQWGRLMQDDITYGVNYLIDRGVVAKDKVVIMGGSYGGYATLAGLAFTPELYAAGVDIVGPSNLFTLLDSIPEYWESARAHLYAMVGDPRTEEGQQILKQASPLFSVDNIDKPLLIVQGANDPRVKQAESDQIVVALRDKNKKVVYLLAEDEGHGFAKPINKLAMFAQIEKFLAEILGGEYQAYMPEEVAEKLKQLTVDVDKVK